MLGVSLLSITLENISYFALRVCSGHLVLRCFSLPHLAAQHLKIFFSLRVVPRTVISYCFVALLFSILLQIDLMFLFDSARAECSRAFEIEAYPLLQNVLYSPRAVSRSVRAGV